MISDPDSGKSYKIHSKSCETEAQPTVEQFITASCLYFEVSLTDKRVQILKTATKSEFVNF